MSLSHILTIRIKATRLTQEKKGSRRRWQEEEEKKEEDDVSTVSTHSHS